MPAMFVSHDMCHVIGGYEPTGEGEIALGGMQLAIADGPDHWAAFLGNLSVHEAGIVSNESVTGKTATLARPGAAEYLAHAMWRGAQCTGDFTAIDHLALVEVPLDEVRARFGVPPLEAS
jgi:ubiquinone biosynthesis protein Coq4